MFSSLKNLFSFEDASTDSSFEENPSFITRPRRIRSMLYLLMEDHTQISIEIDDENIQSSAIREIQKDRLLIDEFNNQLAHQQMQPGKTIKVRAKHQAVHLIFDCKVSEVSVAGYAVKLPDKVYYPQRRSYYRVPLSSVASFPFRASHSYGNEPISGRIEDMSYGGVSLATTDPIFFKKGDLLNPVSLILNNGEVSNCSLIVCTVKISPTSGTTRLGCEFEHLEKNDRRLINQFIIYCERERAKKGFS